MVSALELQARRRLIRRSLTPQGRARRTLTDQTDLGRALEGCHVNGFPVRRGGNIVLLFGAANRDPLVFEDPNRLDVGRSGGWHLSFGRSIHHCLDAPFARLEGRIVLETLIERFPSMRLLDDRPVFHDRNVLRGLKSLPVRCAEA